MSETQGPAGAELTAAVGAILFASDEPVSAREIAGALPGVDVGTVRETVENLKESLTRAGLGLTLEQVAGGLQLATSSDVGVWVRRFLRQRNKTRLSPAALETLAIVAYRQPVTAPEIQAIRGKDPQAAIKGLLDKRLLKMLGRKKVVGNPLLYGTSKEFLVHFGLDRLDDLPSLDEFEQVLGAMGLDRLPLQAEGEKATGELGSAGDEPEASGEEPAEQEPVEADATD